MTTRARTDRKLEQVEAERLAAQHAFDKRARGDERNRLGQFATPQALAEAMLRLAQHLFPGIQRVRFLDPGLGTGGFYSALLKVYGLGNVASAMGFEIDPSLAAAAQRLWGPIGLQVVAKDFTRAQPPTAEHEKPNLIVCNPPYVRHHYLDQETKTRLKTKLLRGGGPLVNGLTGLYGYYLLLAHHWLAKDAGAVWIVPAELLDVNYGVALKRYLRTKVTLLHIHRFDPSDVQFSDALVTSVILAFQNSVPPPGYRIRLTHGGNLLTPSFERWVDAVHLDPATKWGPYFYEDRPTGRPTGHPKLGEFFMIKRGLATGANDFFVLDAAEARRLGLPEQFLRPVLPSQRLIPADVVEADEDGFPRGLPRLLLLDCSLPRAEIKRRSPALDRYLQEGEASGIPGHYLPASRTPWYSQEQRPPAPILSTYMGRKKRDGRCLRFIRNFSKATALNVYLLLYPKPELVLAIQRDPSLLDRIFFYLQSVQNLERLGRVYGGGLNKIEPKELASLELVPDLAAAIHELGGTTGPLQEELQFVGDR